MKTWIVVCLFVGCCSCGGTQHKLFKAKRLIAEAVARGATVKSDTIYKHVKFHVPGVAFNTTFTTPNALDTLYILKDSVRIKLKTTKGNPGKPDTVYLEAKCPDVSQVKKIPVSIDQEIKAGHSTFEMIILAIVCLIVGYFSRVVIKSLQTFFAKG